MRSSAMFSVLVTALAMAGADPGFAVVEADPRAPTPHPLDVLPRTDRSVSADFRRSPGGRQKRRRKQARQRGGR